LNRFISVELIYEPLSKPNEPLSKLIEPFSKLIELFSKPIEPLFV
jgi:hypothetical protein